MADVSDKHRSEAVQVLGRELFGDEWWTALRLVGAVNVINNLKYGDYDYTLQPTAGRFECGTYNMGGLDALRALGYKLDVHGECSATPRN